MQTLRDLLKRNAKTYPDKTAFIFENKRYTFKQVNQRVNSLINALASMGVKKGDRVALLAYNCSQYFEIFNVAKAGMICVPLNYRSVARELVYLINNSEANTFIVEKEFADTILPIRNELTGVKNYICLDGDAEGMANYEQLISRFPPDEPTEKLETEDPSTLFYPIGTPGRPKGSLHTHDLLDVSLNAFGCGYGFPVSHHAAWTRDHGNTAVIAHARIVYAPGDRALLGTEVKDQRSHKLGREILVKIRGHNILRHSGSCKGRNRVHLNVVLLPLQLQRVH